MASPTIESLCCVTTNSDFSKGLLLDFQSVPYNAVSVVAAACGICGAAFQLLSRSGGTMEPLGHARGGGRFLRTRGWLIIKWLAFADMMASFGILIRSASWLGDDTFGSGPDDSTTSKAFCIVSSGMIHYFYTATYVWSLLYAVDVRLVMEGRRVDRRLYHLVAWSLPLALCLTGLLILYLPDLNCHNYMVNPYFRFLPNYLSTFLPITVVMVANPILYRMAFSRVEQQIMSMQGRFTHSERRVVDGLRRKFLAINGVFYLCWLPNVFNGIILWTAWDHLPKSVILVVWYLMAVLNPLQAVFNAMVYRRWDGGFTLSLPHCLRGLCCCRPPPALPPPAVLLAAGHGMHHGDSSEDEGEVKGSAKRYSPLAASFSASFSRARGERTPLLTSSSFGQQVTPPPSAPTLDQMEDPGGRRDRGK
ncbi:G-protein coupled receptor 143 [Chionoecetes opilio]|uniref:G-protein coupled receptor 143 n=1 Tax=Chionoecetes opilio TaxID=41210 RepID=A0A8J4YPP9_CHIOP|nr:G-protein coupled receptor 143 [Chionoecetes opilio]